MEYFKRIFQCVNPSTDDSGNSHRAEVRSSEGRCASEMANSPVLPGLHPSKGGGQSRYDFKNYKQQHLASLSENQAMFESQKRYLEKHLQYANMQIEKVDQKILQVEKIQEKIQEKIDILRGDADWVKFG